MYKAKIWIMLVAVGCVIFICGWIVWPKTKSLPPESRDFPLNALWTFNTDDNIIRPPRLAGSLVVISAPKVWPFSAIYYTIGAETGDLAWKYETANELGGWDELSWAATDNLMILARSLRVEAVELGTGKTAWISSGYSAIMSVATSKTTAFISSKGSVIALELATGTEQWHNDDLPGYNFVVFYDDQAATVLAPVDDLYILDAQDGRHLSTIIVDAEFRNCSGWLESITFYGGRFYCGPAAFDAGTGQTISANDYYHLERWRPLIQSNIMYLRTGLGTILAVDLDTFSKLWEYKPQSEKGRVEIITGVAVVADFGYAIADDGTLRAFDINNGQEIGWWRSPEGVTDWRGRFGGYSGGTPLAGVVSDGKRVFASFGKKTLYAFGP